MARLKGGYKIRAGEGMWVKWDMHGEYVTEYCVSDDWPDGEGWTPLYPPSRVSGDRYQYYDGNTEWVQAANRAMADAANYNFRTSQGY